MSQEITLQELNSAKRSVAGRISRLRKVSTRHSWSPKPSPIARIGAFESDINRMDNILKDMERRLDNARITIELD